MKATKLVVLIAVLMTFGAPLRSQAADYLKSELFLGFRYSHIDGGLNGFGWGTGYAYNFTENLGFAGEVGGVYGSKNGTSFNIHDFLVGPRFTLRGSQFNLFAHGLIGGAVASASGLGSASGFAFAGGGGVDYNLSKTMAFRIAQVDYVGYTGGGTVSSVRAQTGVVWKFGN